MILEVVQSKWSLTWYDPLGPRMCVLELMNGHVLQTLREQLKVPGSRLEGSELLTNEFLRFRESGIRLPRLSRRNNYIHYLCLHFRIHFTVFSWYLHRTFSGMFCVTDIAFYVLQKFTDFVAKQNHDLLQSAREYS